MGSARVRGSLRRRLAVMLIGGAAVLALLLFVLVRNYATQLAQQSQDRILQASVTSILEAAKIREGEIEIDLPYAAFTMLSTSSDDRMFYVIHRDGKFLSGYQGLTQGLSAGQAPPLGQVLYETKVFDKNTVRLATAGRVLSDGRTRQLITASVAQTRDDLAGTLQGIFRTTAAFGIGFFGLAVLLSFAIATSTVRPLQSIAASVGRRGAHDLRPVLQAVPVEMGPLVSALNRLMTRLGTSLTQSEDFIAEAAHRVRTPLATVRTHAETTLQRVDREENRQSLRAMIRAIDESSRAAGQLLDHAMVTFRSDTIADDRFDLVELCQDIVDRLLPVAEMKDIVIDMQLCGPVPVMGDPILVQNAVRNLIDNALKYSPGESQISVQVSQDPRPEITIIDEGPGFPEDQIGGLTGRFARGDNASGTIGSGLGLTIAQDVATAHGGTLVLSNSKNGGGACVVLSL